MGAPGALCWCAERVTWASFYVCFWGKADITQTCGDVRF